MSAEAESRAVDCGPFSANYNIVSDGQMFLLAVDCGPFSANYNIVSQHPYYVIAVDCGPFSANYNSWKLVQRKSRCCGLRPLLG